MGPLKITAPEKGLNFSMTPKKIPLAKNLSSVENGIFSLNQSAKDTIRVSVANILKNCKVPATVNITKEQEKALQNLRKDETVKILPADNQKKAVDGLLWFVGYFDLFVEEPRRWSLRLFISVLADLVMEEIEETTTAPHSCTPHKWWFRYVDGSHACLKKDQVDARENEVS